MTRYITLEEALHVCSRLGFVCSDPGMLDSALHRPAASWGEENFYPDLPVKAAALLHALAKNHPLVDGNKRLAWTLTYIFVRRNGCTTSLTNDEVFDLVMWVSAHQGELDLRVLADRLCIT